MGISERIEHAADEKETKRLKKSTEELFNFLKNLELAGLTDVISELEDIIESGLYERLILTFTKNKRSDEDIRCIGRLLRNTVIVNAFYKLGAVDTFKNTFSNRFNVDDTLDLYRFIESIYIMNTDRGLDFNDKLNVYLSGLDERILFATINFDNVNFEEIPEPDIEFLQSLLNVKWIDSETEAFYNKLKDLMNDSAALITYTSHLNFSSFDYSFAEQNFIDLLIVCNTMSTGKTLIQIEDVITAHMAFFKLINTDLTVYEALPKRLKNITDSGWLVCENCGYSYHLQSNESPEDFVDKCECGGTLKFKKDANDPMNKYVPEDILIPMLTTMICIGSLTSYSLLQGLHLNGADISVRLMLFASAIFISILLYFMSRSFLGYFGWQFNTTASLYLDNAVLICNECNTKYTLGYGESVQNFPKTCNCGGKLICVDSEEIEKGIDFRNRNRRVVYLIVYVLTFTILYFILKLFNVDLFGLYNGNWKYAVIIIVLIFTVFLTTLIIRLLNKLGFKIRFY